MRQLYIFLTLGNSGFVDENCPGQLQTEPWSSGGAVGATWLELTIMGDILETHSSKSKEGIIIMNGRVRHCLQKRKDGICNSHSLVSTPVG